MFRLFIVAVVKRGEGSRRRRGGREEEEREIVASEESSVWWEELGADLMGLTAFGEKGGGGAYLLYVDTTTCFTCVHMFVLYVCVSTCVCVLNACVCDCVLAAAGVYPCPACSLSSSVD